VIEVLLPVEFFLRYKYRDFESNSYQYDINYFHPYLQAQLVKGEDIHVNSFGFRGDEIALKKPVNTFRIVVLGGSTVLNREVPYKKNAVRLLEKKLQKEYPDKKIEVINAGKDGYNSEHSLIQYLFNIKDFSPDLIIMWQGINDLYLSCTPSDNEYGSFKRDYSHAFGALMRMATSYFRPQPLVAFKSVAFDFLLKNLRDNLYSDIILSYKNKAENRLAEDYRKNGTNYIKVNEFPSNSTYERNLNSLISAVKADGVPIILGDQANLYKKSVSIEESKRLIFPNLVCRKDGRYYSMDSIRVGIEKFNETTKRVAVQNNIPFVDLDKEMPKNLSYFLDSVHYTEKGNELIASSLFNFIVKEHFIN
jgi:lysophospholipase L1-like esterase